MRAACQTRYHEIRNLFNHANMRVEITKTVDIYLVYICFSSTPTSPVSFHALLGYPPDANPKAIQQISFTGNLH